MDNFNVGKTVGDGNFGSVFLATNKKNNQKVAIKKMKKKFPTWEEAVKLREVQSLKKLNHPNIVRLKEVIRENDDLYFVFEFLEKNCYELTCQSKKRLPEERIKKYMFQILSALAYMHKNGFFHRDLKPENLMMSHDDNMKLADFGLAREIRSQNLTEYVSTRWYRAPEVVLRSPHYNSKIDIWAVGCIMAEMYTSRPLFPGSSESDQLYKICSVLGPPTEATWKEGLIMAQKNKFTFTQFVKTELSSLLKAPADAHALMNKMLQWDPMHRPTAAQCLSDSYFDGLSLEALNAQGPLAAEDGARNLHDAPVGASTRAMQLSMDVMENEDEYSSGVGGGGGGGGVSSEERRMQLKEAKKQQWSSSNDLHESDYGDGNSFDRDPSVGHGRKMNTTGRGGQNVLGSLVNGFGNEDYDYVSPPGAGGTGTMHRSSALRNNAERILT